MTAKRVSGDQKYEGVIQSMQETIRHLKKENEKQAEIIQGFVSGLKTAMQSDAVMQLIV